MVLSTLSLTALRLAAIGAYASLLAATNLFPQAVVTVEQRPFWTMAGTLPSGEIAFGTVLAAALTTTSHLVVADGAEAKLVVVSPDGRRLSVGRRGDGPGEFGLPTWVGTCGTDSLFAWDLMKRVMSVFSREGKFVRQFSLVANGGAPIGAAVVSCAAGAVAIIAQPKSPEKRTDRNSSAHREVYGALSAFDLSGRPIAQLSSVVVGEVSDTPGGNWLPRPLGAAGLLAALPGSVIYGNTRTGALIRTDLQRRVSDTIVVGGPDRRPDAVLLAAAVDKALEFAPPLMRERMRPAFSGIETPRLLPKISAIQVDPAGVLWVVTSMEGEPALTLEAHVPSGITRLSLRGNMKLLAVGIDRLLCLAETPDGDTELRMYRIQRM